VKLLYPLAKRFIAGHDFESAKEKIEELLGKGYQISVDYVGELSETTEDAARAAKQYIEISNFYKGRDIDMSIKLTQLGLLFDRHFCLELLRNVVETAYLNGHTIRLDMEDSKVTDDTINLCLKLRRRFPNIGLALQSNLYRTKEDIFKIINKKVSIRLVKGAYREGKDICIHPEGDVRGCFLMYMGVLLAQSEVRCAIATHDEKILNEILKIKNSKTFDYEFLYGVRRDLQKSLLKDGYSVRIYLPFGRDWLPYTLRRLKEWKNLKFVIGNILKEWLGLIKKK
jgi:proline dehydrogenase